MPFSSGTFSRVHDFTDDRDNGIRIQASRMDAEMDGIATGLSTAITKDGTQTTTAKIPFAVGLSVIDNQTILLGTNSDIAIQYDETTNDSLEIAANVEGAALGIVLKSDQGDDNADQHKLSIADGGVLTLGSKISGSFVSYLTHTPNSTVASSTLAVAGNLTVGGNLTLGSGAVLSESELEQLDGITQGNVTASKAVVVDSNKDIASFRNITLTGELDAGSLDISGDADIDGTLEADAMTLNGSAITTVATLSTGISNGNLPVFTSGVADDDFLRVNGTAIEGRSASEVLSDIGGQASLTFGISNTNIPIFTSGVVDDDFLRVNGTSIEGRSASEVLSDIGASAVAGSSSIVTTGALDSGSITSGFGNINIGSSTITTTGAVGTGALTVTGTIATDGLTLGDAESILLGASSDMQIIHDGSNSIISDNGTGNLVLRSNATAVEIDFNTDETSALFNHNGAVELFHDNSKRFETTSSGVTVSGVVVADTLDVSGTVDFDGTTNLDTVDIDGAVDMSAGLTVSAGLTTLNGKFLIDGSNNDLMTFRTTGDTANQVLGLQFQNNSEAVTAQIFGTGDNSSSGVFRIKGIGDVDIVTADVGVNGNPGQLSVKHGGDVHVGTGNLVIGTSGKGIDFSANSNASGMSSEILDSYEEGSWTPVVSGSSSGVYALDSGFKARYTKIGDVCHVSASFGLGSLSGSASGGIRLSGFPFSYNGANSQAVSAGVNINNVDLSSSCIQLLILQASSGTSTSFFMNQVRDNTTTEELALSSFSSSSDITFSLTYQVA